MGFSSTPMSPARYSLALDRASRAALAHFAERNTALHLLRKLDSQPVGKRLLLANGRQFAQPTLAAALLDSADASRAEPLVMLERVRLGLQIVRHLPDAVALRARGLILEANALRLIGNHQAAERSLTRALAVCPDRRLKLRALSVLASLRFDQWALAEALKILEGTEQICRDLGDRHELATCLVQQAMNHGENGNPKHALSILMEAGEVLGPVGDPRLSLRILHNMARFELDQGNHDRALKITLRAHHAYSRDAALRVKLTWLRGQIFAAAGHHQAALELFQRSREVLAARGNAQEAALASIDMASTYLSLGEPAQVRAHAHAALRLTSLRSEALVALSLLRSAPAPPAQQGPSSAGS
jgi:tetratricopeptide (TPR) repeat protein